MGPKLIGYAVGILVFGVVFFFRWRQMSRARPLKIERMWIRPAIILAICALVLTRLPPRPQDVVWLAVALALGAVVGWQRGRFVRIVVHPQTHEINQQASPAAMFLILGIVVLRMVLREEAASVWHMGVNLIADASIVFAAGLFTAQQIEMWLRARKLLADARAGLAG